MKSVIKIGLQKGTQKGDGGGSATGAHEPATSHNEANNN